MRVAGIDEVGRGCWAGPLVAGAVVLGTPLGGLRDSKQLSAAQRQWLAEQIAASGATYSLGWVWPAEIDAGGLTWAVRTAMERAVAGLAGQYDELIIDGNIVYLPDEPRARAVVRADATVPAVSAASIIAKVARDHYMLAMEAAYPGYGFGRHVGYGTAEHRAALAEKGVTPIHRTSYKPIRALLV